MIDGQSRLCALIGDPVEHSLSPVMHNAAFIALGLNLVYLTFRVENDGLTAAVGGIRALKVRGFNVTMPYKTQIMPLLDRLDSEAARIGAVNTVVNDAGVLTGFNTDHSGFVSRLRQNGINLSNSKSVLLGSGGAARAIAYALAGTCSEVIILNRPGNLERARNLAQDIGADTGARTAAMELNSANLNEALTEAVLIVNATSAGMRPTPEITPIPGELLHPGLTVVDLVYDPTPTRLLKEARAAGCRTVDGIELLAAQAEASFELWTGMSPPSGLMLATGCKAWEQRCGQPVAKTGLALIGFMGSGKSRTGKILAKKLGLPLRDTDKIIEDFTAKSIEKLFNEDGEETFRRLEKDVVLDVSREGRSIIACGGGVVLDAANMLALNEKSLIVYLKSTPDSILKRVKAGRSRRPLLAGKKTVEDIERLLAQRIPLYAKWADMTVDTSNKKADAVAREIITRIRQHESFNL